MSILKPVTASTRSTLVRLDGTPLTSVTSINNFIGGTVGETETTTLDQETKTFEANQADPGTMTLSGWAEIHTDLFGSLLTKFRNGENVSYLVAVGAKGADGGATDGNARVIRSGLTFTISGTGGTNDPVLFTHSDNASLPGIGVGCYVQYTVGGTLTSAKITARSVTGNSAVLTLGDLSSAPTLDTGTTVSVVIPAIKVTGTGFISSLEPGAEVDGRVSMSLSVRRSGEETRTPGTPDVTI